MLDKLKLKIWSKKIKTLFKESSGITLVELLIALSILAITASIGMMNLINYRNQRDLNITAQEIIAVLRNAQNRSIAQESGNRWGVHFKNLDSPNLDYYELFYGPSYASATIVSKINLRSNIGFEIPSTSSTIIFTPITGLPNASTTVKIHLTSAPSSSSTITVNSNGEIQY